jgi:hypothetical protein
MALTVHPVTGERTQSRQSLSPKEQRRIHRALYRFELFRNLFIIPYGIDIRFEFRHLFDAMDQNFLFLHVFKVWEVEELACVRGHIIGRHAEFLQESGPELSKIYPSKEFGYDAASVCSSALTILTSVVGSLPECNI